VPQDDEAAMARMLSLPLAQAVLRVIAPGLPQNLEPPFLRNCSSVLDWHIKQARTCLAGQKTGNGGTPAGLEIRDLPNRERVQWLQIVLHLLKIRDLLFHRARILRDLIACGFDILHVAAAKPVQQAGHHRAVAEIVVIKPECTLTGGLEMMNDPPLK